MDQPIIYAHLIEIQHLTIYLGFKLKVYMQYRHHLLDVVIVLRKFQLKIVAHSKTNLS